MFVRAQIDFELGNVGFEERGESEFSEKSSRSKNEKQEQIQPTYGNNKFVFATKFRNNGIWRQATLVGGVGRGGTSGLPLVPCPLSLTPPPPSPTPPCECAYLMSPTANQQLNLPLLCKSWQYPRYVLSRHCRRSFLLHGPYPSMMVKIVTQNLHVILICPVRINSRQARIHRVMRSLREGSQHTLGNFFVPNKDFFQGFIEHGGTRLCGHRPLVCYLCCALQAFSFDWGFVRFEIHS